MSKRLNYGKLMKKWMQFYSMTAELSQKMFAAIWARLQVTNTRRGDQKTQNPPEEGEDKNGTHT